MTIRVQAEDFDVGREIAAMRAGDARIGAVASFIGTVRDVNDAATVSTLTLEHYPGMTEKALEAIVGEARARFDIFDALVIHRVGDAAPDRPDRAGRRHRRAPRRGIRCVPIPDGLSEDARAVLEEGSRRPPAPAGSTRARATTKPRRAGSAAARCTVDTSRRANRLTP